MIIDVHGHVSAPTELWAYKAGLLSHRGAHGRGEVKVTDDEIRAAANRAETWPKGHLDYLRDHGTDVQLISPRPFQLMQSEKPAKLVQWFAEECNNIIYRQTKLFAGKFLGVCALPQTAGDRIERAIPELKRCVEQLGFVGCLLNPDPYENGGSEAPSLGDRYWYPLYEKLCELNVPAHIHGTTSRSDRTPYSVHLINEETIAVYGLMNSDVFKDFPGLKIVVSHGGGAIPYQLGRFEAPTLRRGTGERFSVRLRNLHFDTVLYTEDALALLIKTVGTDRCLFGTECPGVGSAINPETRQSMDNVRAIIEKIEWLTEADRKKIFEDNARAVFNLKV